MADKQDDNIADVEGLDPVILQQAVLLGACISGGDDEIEPEVDKGLLSRQRLNEHMIENVLGDPVDENEVIQAQDEPEHDMNAFLAESGIAPAPVDEVSAAQDVNIDTILEEVGVSIEQSEEVQQQPIGVNVAQEEPEYDMSTFLAESGITQAPVDEPDQEQTLDFDQILAQMDDTSVKINNNANLPKVKSPEQDVNLPNM